LKRLFYTFIYLITPTILFGQYLTPDISVLRINKVKKLYINNCLDSSFCFTDEFEFNSKGLMTKEAPGIIGVYSTWDYYNNGKLKTYYSKIHAPSNGDSIYIADHYFYDKNWRFKWIISDKYDNAKVISTDTVYKLRLTKDISGKRNQKRQIIEQDLGDLYFPCAIIFKGRHKIYYDYFDNGLLKNAKVFDINEKLIINFEYKYEYY
jgi:hypothetical protein